MNFNDYHNPNEIKTKYYQNHSGAICCSVNGSEDVYLSGRQVYMLDLLSLIKISSLDFEDWYGIKPNNLAKFYEKIKPVR